ncbi:MAG: hypothetical protein AAF327_11370 [Cyanobacteria bacterium P01_A01_bin.37]
MKSKGDRNDVSSSGEQRVLGVFKEKHDMESAISRLKTVGFPIHTLSIAVRAADSDLDHHDSQTGHPLSGASRLTSGLDQVAVPDIGNVLVMGPETHTFASMEHNHETHDAPLTTLGITREPATLYWRHLADGAYLVTFRGRHREVAKAASILGEHGMRDWGVYDVQRM